MPDHIDRDRRRLLATAATSIAAARFGILGAANACFFGARSETSDELSALVDTTAWLNSLPLTAAGLRGKVVLVDFCTYTCINWLRTLPYVRAWAARYDAWGLVLIGVHSPEFSFEHDLGNVRRAMKELRVEHPVAIDNTFQIWHAFRNRYWPALYLIDARGEIRYSHAGEGEYERTERAIQRLLADAGARGQETGAVSARGEGVELNADWDSLKSLEIYLGHQRTDNFASSGGIAPGAKVYAAPAQLPSGHWALAGHWTMTPEAVVLNQPGGRIACGFHARDVHLVMGLAAGHQPVPFRVLLDGEPPGRARGVDLDEQGNGELSEHRLYQVIRQPQPIVDRQLTVEFLGSGVEAYAFTFG